MTLTLGMIAAQKRSGPYTLTYAGRANSSGSVTSLSGSFNLGAEYRDRIVFIGIVRGTYSLTSATSVTVGGKAGTKIGGSYVVNTTEWWYVATDIGTSGITVQANFADSANVTFVVYVLGGGALGGTTPTLELRTGYTNNSNFTTVTFPSVTNNDLFMAIEVKANGGSSSARNFNSSMSPLTNNINSVGVGTDNDGFGACQVGPITVVSPTSGTIQGTGADSSKPLEVAAIRVRKAT